MNKIGKIMDQLNLFIVGAVVGFCVSLCFAVNHYKKVSKEAQTKIEAYEEYYRSTETLLDSLDGTRNLNLMDTDLATDYGVDYLNAKSIVDSLNSK